MAIRSESAHLKPWLPPQNKHNAVLRLADVANYIEVSLAWLACVIAETRTEYCMKRELQETLSRFFIAWDRGLLVKARVGDEWKIVHRVPGPGLSPGQRPADTPPPVHKCRIDLATLGLRLE
jgi:hypothetical protein